MLPQTGYSAIRQGIVAISLVTIVDRYQLFAPISLFHPLHAVTWVGKDFLASRSYRLGCFLIIRISGILLIESVVVIDEIDRSERTVFLHLSHHTADAVTIVRVVLSVQCHTIVSGSQEDAALGYIPAHTLVHDCLQWFLLVDIRILQFRLRLVFRLSEIGWHIIFREENLWLAPVISVLRNLHQGSRWRYMLLSRIAQEMHVELAVPIRHHRLMVIGPAPAICLGRMLAVGTERLDIVDSYHWRQGSVMTRRICHRGSGIVDAVLLQQSLHDAFRSTEDGAVLVVLRHTHLLAHIGEMNEILGKMSTEIEEAVTIVINEITIAQRTVLRQFDGGWSFHEIAGERFRSLAPRSHRVLGKSHLDIAGIAGIILQYHHIIVLTTLQQSGIYATESRIYQELALGPCLKILGYGIVETVIVLLVFDTQGEVLARHTRCPYHHCLLAVFIPEEFRCPYIHGSRIVHHLDEFRFAPMHQVATLGITEATVAPPAAGPYQMEHTVWGTDDGRVTHHFLLAYLRSQEGARNTVPMDGIPTIDEPQAVGCRLVERG